MSILGKFDGRRYFTNSASSFWLNEDFDTDFKRGDSIDYTKLAATQRAIANFVNIVTGKPIPVIFQSADSSYTDGESVVIGTKLDDKNFDPAVGLALHEGSHIALTDFNMFKGGILANTKMAKIVQLNGYDPEMSMSHSDFVTIKNLLNWIEDRRIDFHIYTTAPGYRMYYEAMYNKYFNDKVIDKALRENEKTDESWDDYMFHVINLTNPNRNLQALKALQDIWNVIDLRNIQRLENTEQSLLVACQVYKLIKDAIAEAEAGQQANKQDESQDESQPQDGMGNGGEGNDEDESEDSDDDSESVSSLSPAERAKLEKAIERQRDFLKGENKKTGKLTKSQASIVNAVRESGTEVRQVATNESGTADFVDAIVIKKLTPGIIASMPQMFESYSEDYVSGKRSLDENQHAAKSILRNDAAVTKGIIFGKILGRKLQLRNADRTLKTTRLQAGKIDRRLISQLGFDNANVFHRIVTDRYKNYFIHISIDASGSMSGDKFRNSITSAVAVAQAAAMTTGIRVQISLRGTDSTIGGKERAVTIYAYDSAHDKLSKIRNYFKYLSVFGCTPEGIAFKSIEQDIKRDAKGDECIFVNYSDGYPTSVSGCAYQYDGVGFTRRVINGFRELGINIVSYFITCSYGGESNSETFRRMYGVDSKFIDPKNMNDVARTLNSKFLELAQ
jgi:flagellar motility protein MotE (MotC chaperone)